MTLKQLRNKKNIRAMISLKIGKYGSLIGYLCRIARYIAPDGSRAVLPIISCDKNADKITGEIPKIYTSYEDLKADYDKVRDYKPRIILLERKRK